MGRPCVSHERWFRKSWTEHAIFSDRWSHLYLEHGNLEKEDDSLTLYDKDGATPLPIDQLSIVFLGPGTRNGEAHKTI
ncbi:MAG: hypothetical protein ABSE73_09310 [Planctomycetota bacterium]